MGTSRKHTESDEDMTTKDYFDRGKKLREQGNNEAAIREFSTALEMLGDSYQHPSVIDDTGTKLALAQHEAERGNVQVAATLYERVVASRLALQERLHPGRTNR